MFHPSPGLWPGLIDDRRDRMLRSARRASPARSGMRVRLGRVLIAVGSMISGERVEPAAHRPALPRSA